MKKIAPLIFALALGVAGVAVMALGGFLIATGGLSLAAVGTVLGGLGLLVISFVPFFETRIHAWQAHRAEIAAAKAKAKTEVD